MIIRTLALTLLLGTAAALSQDAPETVAVTREDLTRFTKIPRFFRLKTNVQLRRQLAAAPKEQSVFRLRVDEVEFEGVESMTVDDLRLFIDKPALWPLLPRVLAYASDPLRARFESDIVAVSLKSPSPFDAGLVLKRLRSSESWELAKTAFEGKSVDERKLSLLTVHENPESTALLGKHLANEKVLNAFVERLKTFPTIPFEAQSAFIEHGLKTEHRWMVFGAYPRDERVVRAMEKHLDGVWRQRPALFHFVRSLAKMNAEDRAFWTENLRKRFLSPTADVGGILDDLLAAYEPQPPPFSEAEILALLGRAKTVGAGPLLSLVRVMEKSEPLSRLLEEALKKEPAEMSERDHLLAALVEGKLLGEGLQSRVVKGVSCSAFSVLRYALVANPLPDGVCTALEPKVRACLEDERSRDAEGAFQLARSCQYPFDDTALARLQKRYKLSTPHDVASLLQLALAQKTDGKKSFDRLLALYIPDIATARRNFGALDTVRDGLPLAARKSIDDLLSAMVTNTFHRPKATPCEIVCQTLGTIDRWGSAEWRQATEIKRNVSETEYAVQNVIGLLDHATTGLCERSALTTQTFAKLKNPSFPPFLAGAAAQTRQEEKRIGAAQALDKTEANAAAALNLGAKVGVVSAKQRTHLEATNRTFFEGQRERLARGEPSTPGQLTSMGLYGLAFGSLVHGVRKKLGDAISADEEKWGQSQSDAFRSFGAVFEKHQVSLGGGSAFTNYAVGLAALGLKSPPEPLLAAMRETAEAAAYSCRIPYTKARESDAKVDAAEDENSAVYRSVSFYYGLYLRTPAGPDRARYRASLVRCLRRLPTEPFGVLASTQGGYHDGPRGFAPYYFWGAMFVAADAIGRLENEVPPEELEGVRVYVTTAVASSFDDAKGFFADKARENFAGLPAYLNPLYALALAPQCRRDQNLPTQSLFPDAL